MSGHSHWQNIRAKKQSEDARKSKIFSKLSRLISIAAREGGGPEENFKLRQAIEKAKEEDMPSDTIERAVKRGTGELGGVEYKEMTLEAYGPGKSAILIDVITDNRNRTVADIKQLLDKKGGKLAEPGSVRYLFERKGLLSLKLEKQPERFQDKDELELEAIDAGAGDTAWENSFLEIYVPLKDLEQLKTGLDKKGLEIESSALGWKPKTEIQVSEEDKEKIEKLFEGLDENDDVQEIYSNVSWQ